MKVEHWHSRYRYSNEQLDYSNLLGACKGTKASLAEINTAIPSKEIGTFRGTPRMKRIV